ncbi:MAG: universal stress protein [Rubricoccaceae bacterium]|nr:universal stress protein [Rubricoccaceae bacterium]
MTKRILVVLDPDHDTAVATRYAVEIAKAHDGAVTGLSLVDEKRIAAASKGSGIGGYAYAERLRQNLEEEVRGEAQQLLQRFVEEVEAAGARHTDDHIAEQGDVVQAISEDMKTHDLLVAGHESHFDYAHPERRTHALADLVEKGAAATLVVESSYRPIRRVLLAYDGGIPAARAMQKFVHLSPFGRRLTVEVVHVRGSQESTRESDRHVHGAKAYLEAYGYADVVATSVEAGSARERILSHAAETEADLIVAGAYSASGLKKLFFGSTAKGLIEDSPVPLFLYH